MTLNFELFNVAFSLAGGIFLARALIVGVRNKDKQPTPFEYALLGLMCVLIAQVSS